MVGWRIPRECERFLCAAGFSQSTCCGCSVVFFARFVLFEHSMKLKETAIEPESLQAAYSFLK